MRTLKIALPLVLVSLTVVAFGQDSTSPPPTDNVPAQDVIVPWRHFGPEPATSSEPNTPPPGTNASPQPQSPSVQITEEDISKKHPHPPEPVQLPAAAQDALPLANSVSGNSNLESQAGPQNGQRPSSGSAPANNGPQPAGGNASSPSDNSPESQVASLTESYEKREADREARRHQLEKAAAKDPATQALAQIQETRLLLEGEQDRMQSAQQLSQAFAALADELASRTTEVRGKVENRKQMADVAEAELDRLNDRTPQLELALRNIAMLPPSAENDQMIRRLDSELAQDDEARKLDDARSLQARHEMQLLQADADELDKEAAEARQKSASFAQSAQDAQLNEGRLADRLEFSVTRQRATDMLNSTSKAIESSVALTGNT
ncbi:MAG: hypothetical protein ACRD3T_13920, partial [Terriglobia bacterium]